jgi:DNA polymerase-3 subunit epsilon
MSKQIFIDVETTGVDPIQHGLVQVAGAIVIDGKLKESFNYFMCPPSDKTFEVRALEVIGMDMKKIETFQSSAKAYSEFHSMLRRYVNKYDKTDKFHFIAYNSPFDVGFIRQWFLDNLDKYFGSMFWTPDICVMRLAGHYLQDQREKLKNFKLSTVCEFLDIKADGKLHDAMIDIELTMRLYGSIRDTKDLRLL